MLNFPWKRRDRLCVGRLKFFCLRSELVKFFQALRDQNHSCCIAENFILFPSVSGDKKKAPMLSHQG
jgi:hypothetical protein